MRCLVLALLAACGGSPKPAASPPAGSAHASRPAAQPITAEEVCDKMAVLRRASCGVFAKLDMPRDACIADMRDALADPQNGPFMRKTAECIVNPPSCDQVTQCLISLGPTETDLRACNDPNPDHKGKAVGIPRAEWEHRNGAGVTRYSQARSSKAQPIEMCTISAENEWLMTLACDDGSKPLSDRAHAELARVANLGEGGRCGSVIDQYRVTCPERTYDIFIDGYVCPLP